MQKFIESLAAEECAPAATCLGMYTRTADTGELMFREGEPANCVGIVLTGSVNVVRYSVDGRARVLTHVAAGESFGTSFALGGANRYFANIVAAEPTEALLISGPRLLAPCARNCPLHVKLLAHLLGAIARRNTNLARKIDCLSQHSTREKILAYLHIQAETAGSPEFDTPFTRQELADYLNVDRAGLSTELGKLVKEGKLETTRKHFKIKMC